MIARKILLLCLLLGNLTLFLRQDANAAAKSATAPGTYRDWNGDIDEITIFQPFNAASFEAIAVESFDMAGVTLPNPGDNTYAAARSAMNSIKPAFMAGLMSKARRKIGAGGAPGHTLIIRARLTKLDPGSQAARYWGFGAGAVKIQMIGEIVDGVSKKTLVRFRQERRSGFGLFGGGYQELFTRTARQIGEDIATLVNAF
ncbi:MAG: hypothetical protein DLM73_11720 [Chthoniobacterales bacterium]|nr:MAG: hypothetical protein DLM73_11720 [Chthoniobacterales bacterium]